MTQFGNDIQVLLNKLHELIITKLKFPINEFKNNILSKIDNYTQLTY